MRGRYDALCLLFLYFLYFCKAPITSYIFAYFLHFFRAMFPCQTTDSFTMSKSKVSYVLSDGLGPFFLSDLINHVNSSDSVFTLHYDETTSQIKKQMDIGIGRPRKMKSVCVTTSRCSSDMPQVSLWPSQL